MGLVLHMGSMKPVCAFSLGHKLSKKTAINNFFSSTGDDGSRENCLNFKIPHRVFHSPELCESLSADIAMWKLALFTQFGLGTENEKKTVNETKHFPMRQPFLSFVCYGFYFVCPHLLNDPVTGFHSLELLYLSLLCLPTLMILRFSPLLPSYPSACQSLLHLLPVQVCGVSGHGKLVVNTQVQNV